MSLPTQNSSSYRGLTVGDESGGMRLDIFVSSFFPTVSRNRIQSVVDKGGVLHNGKRCRKRTTLKPGDRVMVDEAQILASSQTRLLPQEIDLVIIYEDEWFVAVDKSAGMVVHPGSGNPDGTLVNALLFHLSNLSEGSAPDRPGIVHRLDKNTSGVVIAAKTDEAHYGLARLFAQREVQKQYIGVCMGVRPQDSGIIDAPIGRRRGDPTRWGVRPGGKQAATEYSLLAHRSGTSLLRFLPRTGRTHQIRVHCSHSGFPIVADSLYGGGRERTKNLDPVDRPFAHKVLGCFARHALHAHRIRFIHPMTGAEIDLAAPLPTDFRRATSLFGWSDEE